MPVPTFALRPDDDDPYFDGIGVVDGGGATSVLVKDYPPQQRDEILDLMYRPRFGASVSTLLVEIPGDGNSTQGSMPSHQHTREDLETRRGYMWWVLAEAKRRNPELRLDAVAWSAPGWLGDGEFWSQDTADYYVSWLTILRSEYGLELDAIGCRNEKGVNLHFAKLLRAALDRGGFDRVRIHAFDNWPADKFDFVADLRHDAAAADAIDIIGAHVLYERPGEQASIETRTWAAENGKVIWNTEDHVYRQGFDCLIGLVECFNESYLLSGATKTVIWHGIAGVYPLEPYSEEPAAILAREPWSGHYAVREALWAYAHYGQFTAAGWRYMPSGCGALSGGGTVVALRDHVGEYSVVAETRGASGPQTLRFETDARLSSGDICVWRSTREAQFERLADVRAENGAVEIELAPDAVYSLSTTTGQHKGGFAAPASAAFPFPYRDDLAGYGDHAAHGFLPQYTADIAGAFELVDIDGSPAIRQAVPVPTISWAPDWKPYTIIGDDAWTDYEVSAWVRVAPGQWGGLMARVNHVGTGYGFVPKCYYAELDGRGAFRLVESNGKVDPTELVGDAEQRATIRSAADATPGGERILAEGRVSPSTDGWHRVGVRVTGSLISVWIDGVECAAVRDDRHRAGMAGLIASAASDGSLSQPAFRDLRIDPIDSELSPSYPVRRAPLYPSSRVM